MITSSFRTRGDRRPRQAIISAPPIVPLVIAAPYSNDRDSRMELTDRRSLNVACDLDVASLQAPNPLGCDTTLKARVGLRVTPPTLRFGVGSFFVSPCALQSAVRDLSESLESQLSNSFVPEQSRTRSPHVLSHAS